MQDAEFNDPRLVAVYDAECPWSRDDDYFVEVVRESGARRVLDLGCGTGRLALGLAERGYEVTGVDPAIASLEAARAKPGAEGVTWVLGTSSGLPADAFGVALMTSHVAQVFLDDESWSAVLADLHRALVTGGRLAFDARDPEARAWENWHGRVSQVEVDGRLVTITSSILEVAEPLVTFRHSYRFTDGSELTSTSTLRWRSEDELRASLTEAGFRVDAVYGGWQRQSVGAGTGELLVVASRAG